MSLTDLASVGSLASALAVLMSLIYLAAQLRQTARNQRALAQQSRAARSIDHLDRVADPGIIDGWSKAYRGDPDITLSELRQFTLLSRSTFYSFEDVFFQHKQGLLEDAAFDSTIALMRFTFAQPGLRVAWRRQRLMQDPTFRDFVDEIVASVPLAPASDELADWKNDLAAERATGGPGSN